MKHIAIIALLMVCNLFVSSCKKDDSVDQKDCNLTSLHDEGGTFTNNTMSFEYGADGKITKITGDVFSYEFNFHDDSVNINEYDHFQSLITAGTAKLNDLGLIVWERDTFYLVPTSSISTYSYDNNGMLLNYVRQGTDTVTYDFIYSNGNAVSCMLNFGQNQDTIFFSFEYFEGTSNSLLILLPDADDIMLSGLYGKTSNNLLKQFTMANVSFSENYLYEFDENGNPKTRYEIFMGDTLGNTSFEWNCN